MPNATDVHMIIKRLKSDKDLELMRHELENLLETELTKPASEINMQLVDELLSVLEDAPSEGEKQAVWNRIKKQASRKAARRRLTTAQRIAASVLILLAVSFISIGSAYAFNWTFLLKFLQPLTETFGIYSANNLNTAPPEQSQIVYSDEETGNESFSYTSREDMPVHWNGYRVLPAYMPERYQFMQGSVYEDKDISVVSATYTAEEDFFILTITIFSDDEDVSSLEYQKTQSDPIVEIIAGHEVTYYRNLDETSLHASWIDGNAHYSSLGNVTEGELREIIQKLAE